MGVWGAGLYSGDFAMDLRSTIRAVARLPFDGDKLVDILCETEPTVASNPDDADHTNLSRLLRPAAGRGRCSRSRRPC